MQEIVTPSVRAQKKTREKLLLFGRLKVLSVVVVGVFVFLRFWPHSCDTVAGVPFFLLLLSLLLQLLLFTVADLLTSAAGSLTDTPDHPAKPTWHSFCTITSQSIAQAANSVQYIYWERGLCNLIELGSQLSRRPVPTNSRLLILKFSVTLFSSCARTRNPATAGRSPTY